MIDADTLPSLFAARVVLRPLEDRDAPQLVAIFSDRDVMRYWSTPAWTDPAEAARLLDSIRRCFAERSLFQWGVARRSDDLVIGTCTLCHLDRQNRRAEIGFALRRDCWGAGYMSEALGRLLRYAFETLALHRLEADVDPRNAGSIRLLERLGFVREGLLRERWLVNGEVNDTVFFGLLRSEWRGG